MKLAQLLIILGLVLQVPGAVYAQTVTPSPTPLPDPGQDTFQLTPDKLRMFQGYDPNSSAGSLFNGDSMKNNGLFTTPNTQLGGAAPYAYVTGTTPPPPTQPNQTNVDTANYIVLTSKYEPASMPITHDTVIKITVTMQNVSQVEIDNIVLKAELQDKNATLLTDPAPDPAFKTGSSIDKGLTWDRMVVGGKSVPINLKPLDKASFSWAVKANADDTILRWKFTATFGAGESILLQWIPITNPNPTAASGTGNSTGGSGGTNPCSGSAGGSGPFPDNDTGQQIVDLFKKNWNIILAPGTDSSAGSPADYTSPQYHGMLKAWWEVLTTVECTTYLTKGFGSSPLTIQGYANGGMWWGEYMGGNVQYMWIDNISQGTVPNIKQNLIHELGHVYEGANPDIGSKFEATTCGKGSVHPYISGYGYYGATQEGNGCNESFAEMNGYYVERDDHEWGVGTPYCPTKNPYDWNQAIYYNFAKTEIWGGKEFGPPAPDPPTSC